ncbi:MAG: hypothetical protein RL266_1791 [Bacteroidota bacterium]|jgi:hypothetical protein
MLVVGLMACNNEADDCPAIWNLDKAQVSAFANSDSSGLLLEVWNPASANAITLEQGPLVGNFSLSVSLVDFEWDSLVRPQFRLEVYDPNHPDSAVNGIAVNDVAYYCYIGTGAADSDMRLIPFSTGLLTLERVDEVFTCTADVGGVLLAYSDSCGSEDLNVRLALGAVENDVGSIVARINDFTVSSNGSASSMVFPDDFDCESWSY